MSELESAWLSQHFPRLLSFLSSAKQAKGRYQANATTRLLRAVSNAATPKQLTQAVNNVQERMWKIYSSRTAEQLQVADQLIAVLNTHVLYASSSSMRTTAAAFLRMLLQMGMTSQPASIFGTLVTVIVQTSENTQQGDEERYEYIKLLFECFWPFRYPYPAFSWEQFPPNAIFYPLAPLLDKLPLRSQEMLLCIFSELPHLSENELTHYLLPFALRWSQHSNAEYRRLVCDVLARMNIEPAYAALLRLQVDSDAAVRERATHALCHTQQP